ncbi:hypothetical protein AW083_23900 [Escherichia coli]|nr:hypothetical protein BE962_00850 [Escherichia coli]OTC67045.1 hypothetical protein AW083_23900 [Escherichia coli]OTD03225.1 hypothetical protein AW090_23795 [Escherichia coli]OTD55807.1 hypothetical protein AW099_23870 [Escherichia coli]
MFRRSDGNTSISPENIAGQSLSVGFRPLPQTTPYITLCLEWTKLREENNRLYEINNKANRGWRGFILRLIGVNLPDKRTEFTQRLLLTRKISGSVMKK